MLTRLWRFPTGRTLRNLPGVPPVPRLYAALWRVQTGDAVASPLP